MTQVLALLQQEQRVAGILGPQHRMAVAAALRISTVGSAPILGWDHALGRLEPGKGADGMCLDRDPRAVPVDQVRQVRVTRTSVHGRHVFPLEE